jgi:hypothetical protein
MKTRELLILSIYSVIAIGLASSYLSCTNPVPICLLFISTTFSLWLLVLFPETALTVNPRHVEAYAQPVGDEVLVNDEPPHNTDSPLCWCAPHIEKRNGVELVIHKSLAELGGRVKVVGNGG